MATADRLEYVLAGRDELTRPLKKAESQMKNLGRTAQQTSKQMTLFGNSVKDVRKFNMGALQQAGYQVGDYAVQVANGTSKMQAFGQQAPQFLQIFGPIGSVVGAAVAILAAAGVAFEKSSQAAEKAAGKAKTYDEQVKLLEQSIRSLTDAQILNSTNIEMIRKKYGAMTDDLREFLKIQRELAITETIEQTSNSFEKLLNTKEYIKAVGELGSIKDDIETAEKDLKKAEVEGSGATPEAIAELKKEIASLETTYASLNQELDDMPEGKIMAISEEFLNAAQGKNFEGMKSAIISLREQIVQLPAVSRQALLPMVVQMEGQMRSLAVAMEPVNKSIDRTVEAVKPILDPRDPNYDPVIAEFHRIQAEAGKTSEEAKKGVKKVEREALSLAEAQYLLAKGALPPQARADLVSHKDLYKDIRKAAREAADEAEGLGKTTLSVIQAKFMADKGILPPQAMEDFVTVNKEIEKFYDNLRSRRRKEADEAAAEAEKLATLADPLAELQARTKLNTDLLHVTDARRQVMEAIFQSERNYTPQQIDDTVKQIEAYSKQVKEMERIKQTAESIGNAFEDAFMSMLDGTKSAKEAFKDMTRSIISDLYRQYVAKQVTGFISNAIGGFIAGPVQGPNLPSANGGGYTGNGARAGGLDGRGGFMAMLHPRETVVDHTKGQSGGVVVNQTFQFSANGDDSVKQIIAQAAPTIAKMAQQGIMDARRRGGQVKQVFG